MIFIFSEDRTLRVVKDITIVQNICEGIDVSNSVYQFFDEDGNYLEPEFTKPNKEGKIIGPTGWVVSGQYLLKPSTKPGAPSILKLLDSVVELENNVYFKSIEEIKKFLTRR